MLNIFESNQIDQLFSLLTYRVKANQRPIFHPNQIIVTSLGVQQWLLKSLTDTLGVFVNGQFHFPIHLIKKLATDFDIDTGESYQADVLRFRLFKLLQQPLIYHHLENSDELFYAYLYRQDDTLKTQRLWKMANSLSVIFSSYQWQRPEWLQQWENNRTIVLDPLLSVKEKIQSFLWRALLTKQFTEKSTDNHQLPHHHMMEKIIHTLKNGNRRKIMQVLSPWENGLTLWHVLPLRPSIWQVIQALSEHIRVDVYFLNPSAELWSEHLYMPFVEESLKKQHGSDNEQSLFYQHHPLLMVMGQVGAESHKQFLQTSGAIIESNFMAPNDTKHAKTLLTQVRQAIYDDLPQTGIAPMELIQNDNSLQIHCCPNRYTELKKLHTAIIKWLQEDHTRRYNDILILAPNMINYADYLPIIFADIPYLAPRNSEKDCVYEAFAFFLHFLEDDNPLTLDHLNQFFQFSIVRDKLSNTVSTEGIDNFIQSIANIGFHWGVTDEQRQRHGFMHGVSLSKALDIFWLNLCTNDDLPLNQWQYFGHLHTYVKKIVTAFEMAHSNDPHTHASPNTKQPIQIWLAQWQQWVQDLFVSTIDLSESVQKEYEHLLKGFNYIQRVHNNADFTNPISFSSMHAIWRDLAQSHTTSTDYSTDRMIFANLLEMHSVPAKFIALIGLDDRLNQTDNHSFFDLTWQLPQPYDYSDEANTNYCLLTCILLAYERLWLSYSIDDQHKIRNPAVPLDALMDYLHSHINHEAHIQRVIFHHHKATFSLHSAAIKNHLSSQTTLAKAWGDTRTNIHNNEKKDNSLIYCKTLSYRLFNPIKTYLSVRGGKIMKQGIMEAIEPPMHYEESTLNALDRALWRTQMLHLLLTKEKHHHSVLGTRLIEKTANHVKYLSSTAIAQQLHQEMAIILNYVSEFDILSTLACPTQPIIYQCDLHQQVSIHAQPQFIRQHQPSQSTNGRQCRQQFATSGGNHSIQKLLHVWFNHLVLNITYPTDSTYLYFEGKADTLKLQRQTLPAIDNAQAIDKLKDIIALNNMVEKEPIWAPPNMTYEIANKIHHSLTHEENIKHIKNVRQVFTDRDQSSPWLKLLNNHQIYDLSVEQKTWQDSLFYAGKLWHIQ